MLSKEIYDLLPAKMQDAGDAMRALHSIPDEQLIPLLLGVANHATQGLYDVSPAGAWKKSVMSLYITILCRSGGRKTESLNELMDGQKRFMKDEVKRFKEEEIKYKPLYKKWEKEFNKAVEDNITPLPKEPSKPVGFLYRLEKVTTNGLINALHSIPFSGLINSDAAEFFSSHSFQDKGSGRDTEIISMLSKLYSGETVQRQTGITDDNVSFDGRRFNMITMLQAELATFLQNKKYRDQGFVPRILISNVPDYVPSKTYLGKEAQKVKDQLRKQIEPFSDRVYDMLSEVMAKSIAAKQNNPLYRARQAMTPAAEDLCELELDMIEISNKPGDNALKLFEDYTNLSQDLSRTDDYKEFAGFMVRRYEGALRIAATLAVFEKETEITERWAKAGIGLMDWFTEQRLNLDLPVEENEALSIGKELVRWMKKKGFTEVNVNQAVQNGPAVWKNTNKAQREKILDELSGARELITVREEVSDTNGKRMTFIGIPAAGGV